MVTKLNVNFREALALAASSQGAWISLHTGDPGVTGANEASVGRQQTTWVAGATDGSVVGSKVSFEVPAGTYTHVGVHSAATGTGTFLYGKSINAVQFPGPGVFEISPIGRVPQEV